MSTTLQKLDWESWTPITKAVEKDGEWLLSGPVASQQKDYDGEIMEKAGIISGLDMHDQLGGQVDWDHMWARTHDPDTIIGRSVERPLVDSVPWMVTKLRKSLPLAQKCWRLANDPDVEMKVGYSVQGSAIHDSEDKSRIVKTVITMVTLAPQPKGFDQFVISGRPTPGLTQIAKAICGEEDPESILGVWEPYDLSKAFTTGNGVVLPGDTGGRTLRTQNLLGDVAPDSFEGRRRKRKKKRTAVDPLVKALESFGFRDPEYVALRIRGQIS